MPPKLIIEVLGDTSNLERSFKRAGRSAQGFNKNLSQAGRGAVSASLGFKGLARTLAFTSGAFLGGAGLVAGLKSSVSAASNLAEQTSKTNVVFEEAASVVKRWSTTTATAMGLASDKSLEAASTFGLLFRNIGELAQPAANLSQSVVKLGADLASFNNTSVDDALQALRSGLTGEIEPLRRYGVFLSEARVKTQALADTNKKSADDLTTGEKVLARYKLILQDTTRAQGDFTRTSGGLANQQRILSASVRQLQIGIGRELIPEVLKIVREMNVWLGKSGNQKRVTDAVKEAVSGLRGVVAALVPIVKGAAEGAKAFSDAVGGAKNAVQLLGSAVVGLKLAGMVAGLQATRAAAGGAAASVGVLTGRLAVLRAAGPIAIGIALVLERNKLSEWLNKKVPGGFDFGKGVLPQARDALTGGGQSSSPGDWVWDGFAWKRKKSGGAVGWDFQRRLQTIPEKIGGTTRAPGAAAAAAALKGVAALSAKQRNALLLAQAELTTSTRDDLAALTAQRSLLGAEIAATRTKLASATGDEAEKLATTLEGLLGEDAAAFNRIASIQEGAASDAKSTAAKIKKAAEKRMRALQDSLKGVKLGVDVDRLTIAQVNKAMAGRDQSRQFRALGLTGEGGERAPTVKGLRAMLGNLEGDVKGTPLDTSKMRSRFAVMRKIISGAFGAVREDVRRTIKGMIDDIDGQLGDKSGPLTKARAVSTKALTEGLGLTQGQRAQFRGRLAGAHLTTMPTSGARARGDTHIHIHAGTVIGNSFERAANELAIETQKALRRRGHQTSGRIGP